VGLSLTGNHGLGRTDSYVTQDSDTEYRLFDFQLFVVDSASSKTTLQIEGHDLTMEIDTGAAVSLV